VTYAKSGFILSVLVLGRIINIKSSIASIANENIKKYPTYSNLYFFRYNYIIEIELMKPTNLQGFHNEVTHVIPELDTFEEFCSNIPDQDNLEINFSKPSQDSR
jgi:hypothetical protein